MEISCLKLMTFLGVKLTLLKDFLNSAHMSEVSGLNLVPGANLDPLSTPDRRTAIFENVFENALSAVVL